MEKNRQKKLSLKKFTIAKLNNLSSIYGGSNNGGDGDEGDTVTDKNTKITTREPTIK